MWLVSVGRELEARDKLLYIAKVNRVPNLKIDELTDEKFETHKDIDIKKDFTIELTKNNENLAIDDDKKVREITDTTSDFQVKNNETQK